tara:strand:- start:3547 stop:3816 length:270 start_codon:yes stop_codon:yes gene_type:complete
MIVFAIVLGTILFWATSNVCQYNFVVEKKTKQLNIVAKEIDPSIPNAKVYYFQELNCNDVDLSWDYERVLEIHFFFEYYLLYGDHYSFA